MTVFSQLITTVDVNNNISTGLDTDVFAGQVTGTNNVTMGAGAAATVVSTTGSTFIGAGADVVSDGRTNVTAIGAGAKAAVDNAVILGLASNVGIGTDSPAYGMHLGAASGAFVPQVYLTSSTAPGVGVVPAGDAVISVTGGVASLTTSIGSNTLLMAGPDTFGNATLAGTTGVVVSTAAVTSTSVILVSRNTQAGGAPMVTAVGSLTAGSVVDGVSFTIYSSVIGDISNCSWFVMN